MRFPIIKFFLLFGFASFFSYACSKSEDENVGPIELTSLNGYVQKGPFVMGSSVTIHELDPFLNQTGRAYSTTIIDNNGSFEQKAISLISPYVEIEATGYYFNEVTGENASSPLTLSSIVNLRDKNSSNVNILTTLERQRIIYLVQHGSSFANASRKAHTEVLDLFHVSINKEADLCDLTSDASLLAISGIILGKRSSADITELIAKIANDIRTDGILNDSSCGNRLVSNASVVSASEMINNLMSKYSSITYDTSAVEAILEQFKTETSFESDDAIEYPAKGYFMGFDNLLSDLFVDGGHYRGGDEYCFAANTKDWQSLKIVAHCLGQPYMRSDDLTVNWFVSEWDFAANSQTFIVINKGNPSDIRIFDPGMESGLTIDYYENGSEQPTRTKVLYFDYY